jgi:CBS domain-containing protein
MDDTAAFLRAHPPFDTLDDAALGALAAASKPVSHDAGAIVLGTASGPPESAFVVRDGAVELVADGRVFDLLGEGEMFGYAAMLAELPVGFTARAAEPTTLLRIPEAALRPVLERPDALRYVARTLAEQPALFTGPDRTGAPDPAERPVRELIRAPALVVEPSTPVRDAARRMAEAGASCVLCEAGSGLGIVTDRDLRTRVVALGADGATPLHEVMTAPARTVAADRSGTEAMMEMLDHGIRHLPVLDAHGRLLGVVDDIDLIASERRAPFRLRARIAAGETAAEVAVAARELPRTVIALHDARVAAATVGRVIASIHDTATRRLIELAERELGRPPVPYAWLALGSFGRREPFPASDADSALAWDGPDDPQLRDALLALAERVIAGLSDAGIRPCPDNVRASNPAFARSIAAWERAAHGWMDDPERDRGLMLIAVAAESATVAGPEEAAARIGAPLRTAPRDHPAVRRLASAALATRPPTGFLRQFVLLHTGERRGLLDIKRAGLLPIVNVARWAAMAGGASATATTARLDAAQAAGTLEARDAALLHDAFELFAALRMEHQVERLRAGQAPDDLIDPTRLTRLTRSSLREAFRSVAAVQRGLATQLALSGR